jgi:hypothetical protein
LKSNKYRIKWMIYYVYSPLLKHKSSFDPV